MRENSTIIGVPLRVSGMPAALPRELALGKLQSYPVAKARRAYLELAVERLERELERQRQADMEAAALCAPRLTGMPRGTDVASPVEKQVEGILEGKLSPMAAQLQRELAKARRERDELDAELAGVEMWLSCLREQERWVVERKLMQGACWREVEAEYGRRFGVPVSVDTLKRMRNRALERVYWVAGGGEG